MSISHSVNTHPDPFDRSQKQTVTLLRHLENLLAEVPFSLSETPPAIQRKEIIRLLFMAMIRPHSSDKSLETLYLNLFKTSPPPVFLPLAPVIEKLHWTCALFHLTPSHLGALYEMLLLEAKKKKAGSFYTPYPLALAMAKRLKHYLPQNKSPLHVLDPSVGGGVFIQALQDLADEESSSMVIHGWDQDADIIETTRLSLWWEAGCPHSLDLFLKSELQHQDTLLVSPTKHPLFSAIIGNPPYLSVKQGLSPEKRTLYESQYQCAQGQYDLYSLFIEQGLRLLKPQGLLAFLLPKPLLVNDQQRPIRELLLREEILEIWDIGKDAFVPKAAVESTVIFVKKNGQTQQRKVAHCFKRIQWQGGKVQQPVETGQIQQSVLASFPEKSFNLWLTPENVKFLKTIEAQSVPFQSWLAEDLPNGRGMEIGKNQCRKSPKAGFQPVLTGQDVTAFHTPSLPGFYTEFNQNDAKHHKSPRLYQSPKLMIRRVGDRPIASMDEANNTLTLNTLYNFHLADTRLYPVACAVLNSNLLARWLRERFYFSERLFPYLRQQQILALPMPHPERLNQPISPALGLGTLTYQILLTQLYNELKSARRSNRSIEPLILKLNNVVEHLFSLS